MKTPTKELKIFSFPKSFWTENKKVADGKKGLSKAQNHPKVIFVSN